MKLLHHSLTVVALSALLCAACGKKEEAPVPAEPTPAPVAAPAPEPTPAKEEPGGWVPPAADAAPAATPEQPAAETK